MFLVLLILTSDGLIDISPQYLYLKQNSSMFQAHSDYQFYFTFPVDFCILFPLPCTKSSQTLCLKVTTLKIS